jgi:hypothetical protein
MSDVTFRTAVEPTEAPKVEVNTDNSVISTKTPNDLVATYSDEHGKPYVAKYLNVDNIANEPEYKRDLGEIEGFIQDRVAKKQLDNSTHATDKYLKELEKKAGLTGYENANKRITSLLAYIDFIRKIES